MFPYDAQTLFWELQGPDDHILIATSTNTILGVTIQQSGTASDSWLLCGTSVVAKNYAKDFHFTGINYVCHEDIKVEKTGNDDASFVITYVPYDLTLTSTTSIQQIEVTIEDIPSYRDWLFVSQVEVFLLAFVALGVIFSFFRRK